MTRMAFMRLAVALCFCMLLCGCGSKINKANYDKVKNDMSEKEVEAILGPGEEQASMGASTPGVSAGGISISGLSLSGKNKVWKEGSKIITVTFVNDKVIVKAQTGL